MSSRGAQSVQGDPVNGVFNIDMTGPNQWGLGVGETFNLYQDQETCTGTPESATDAELAFDLTCANGVLSLLVEYVIAPTHGSTVMALRASGPIMNGMSVTLAVSGGTLIGGSPVATVSWQSAG